MSYTLGPRRGGGITDGGFADSTQWKSYRWFDTAPHYAAFSAGEKAAMRALIAFSCLLILAAAVSLVMIVMKSWLKLDGKRKKTRLTTYILCLILLIAGRATLIDDLVARLETPTSRSLRINYYDDTPFYGRHIVVVLFSWLSDITIFSLALVEITRINGTVKRSMFEIVNFVFIAVLFVLAAAAWGVDLGWTWSNWLEAPMNMPRAAIAGLSTAYVAGAFLFVTGLLVALTRKYLEKSHRVLLCSFISALWLGQALELANKTVQEFSSSANAFTSALALSAVVDIVWAVKVLLLTLLAWNSHKAIRSGSTGYDLAAKSKVQKASQSSATGSTAPLAV